MEVVIFGSRSLPGSTEWAIERVSDAVEQFEDQFDVGVTGVACGMARGGDRAGFGFATRMSLRVTEFHADWAKLGRKAGPTRNAKMGRHAGGGIGLFHGGLRCIGSLDMARRLESNKKPLLRVIIPPEEIPLPLTTFTAFWSRNEERMVPSRNGVQHHIKWEDLVPRMMRHK